MPRVIRAKPRSHGAKPIADAVRVNVRIRQGQCGTSRFRGPVDLSQCQMRFGQRRVVQQPVARLVLSELA